MALVVSGVYHLSRSVRKRDYCLCENKGADQLRSNCEADQRLCFRYTDSTNPFLLKSGIVLACFSDCTGRFVLDLVGNTEDRFSRVTAHFSLYIGRRITSLECVDVKNKKIVIDAWCFQLPKPHPVTDGCNTKPCPPRYGTT